jgi:hypothetical protein
MFVGNERLSDHNDWIPNFIADLLAVYVLCLPLCNAFGKGEMVGGLQYARVPGS